MYIITYSKNDLPVAGAEKVATVEEAEAVVKFAAHLGEELSYMTVEEAQEANHAYLLKRLQSARNYSYEANMGDYSMASINRAQEQVDAAKQALIDAGYEIPAW